MTNDAADRVESLRRRFAALADDDATALGQVEWQARRIAHRHGNDVEARALHIAVLARLGRRADGLAALEAALPLLPWATTPVTALRLAGAAIGFGRAAEATALLRRVLSRGAAFPPAAMAPADMDLLALVPLVAGDTALLADVAGRLAGQDAAPPAIVYRRLGRADLADHQRVVLARVGGALCEVRLGLDPADDGNVILDYRLTFDPADRPPTVVAFAAPPPRLVERFARVPALAHLPRNEG